MSISVSSENSTSASSGATRIISLVFVLVGVLVCYLGYSNISLAWSSDGWPTTEGVVVQSKVRLGPKPSSDKIQKVYPDVRYTYEVNDQSYSAERISFANLGSDSEFRVKDILNDFPKGKKVEVYYQPDDPKSAVLEPGISFSSLLVPVVGGLFVFFGLLMLVVSFRQPKVSPIPVPQ